MNMYEFNRCRCSGCKNNAMSTIDENDSIVSSGWCFEHIPDIEDVASRICSYMMNHDTIIGLNCPGLTIKDLNLSNKRFYGCNFQNCSFQNIHADGIRMRMGIYDGCTFTDCNFINSNIQFTSFAGSKLVHVILTGSDLIHINFNGVTVYQSSFDDSDLYNSRFIKSVLMNTSMRNCNLKKTVFYSSVREHVSFKLSNTREALVDRNRGGLMGDFEASSPDEDILNSEERQQI